MEITIKINGRFVSVEVSAEVADYLEQAKRNNRKLYRERQRYWDGRECDEYIIATEGRLPYCATPEELVCQQETLDEILAVLALCTATQRERFLLYALHDFSYAEIGRLCGCSKSAVEKSVRAVKNIFKKFWK
ncbi:RNA polymerase sigma factor [uncultured Oscillibacter sp.]|uniref:RNA polymerase sigma factor n=1 Tax=uncultured Oscillibacter sp. TaxID=876091 RepID=UPI0026193589|nr:sigma factor-like helix-turn-helix DNA-binding protein [uncultured Oscillibacter sp.]